MKLNLENISKKYDKKMILKDISIELTNGVYGLLGANGTGKTTLMKIITNLISPTSGKVLFDNKNISDNQEEFYSKLGFLPQDFTYYPEFTGLRFLKYLATLKGLQQKEIEKKSLELLKKVGLEEVMNNKIKSYSGGMKQRLGIAQALINEPEILILDEPTVGLDPKERVKFRNLLSSLAENKIILLSTHIVSDIEYIADEILILKNGIIENKGTPKDLIQKIKNQVWYLELETQELKYYMDNFIVSNQKHIEDSGLHGLRLISNSKPADKAKLVEPNLEDLYLSYFGKA
ncbi:ABC transporter ATP-binding protein [Streptococcus sp. A22]|uniref:ABC transporter ATP-binding protein n=1 Tax=Streptococcus sp. A22 TaxID=3373126 RepID=UPI00374DF08E